ncbi:MAG: hypothetical protein WBM99_13330 [Psychromonas sp.]
MSGLKNKVKNKKEKKSKEKEYLSLVESAVKNFSRDKSQAADLSEFASTPYKDKPCEKCKALTGGLCKCALKKIK